MKRWTRDFWISAFISCSICLTTEKVVAFVWDDPDSVYHRCLVTLVLPVKTAFDKTTSQYENQRTVCAVLMLWQNKNWRTSKMYVSPQTSALAEVKIWFIIQPYVNVSPSSRKRTGPKTGWKICRAEPSSLTQLVENISPHTHGGLSICVRPLTDIMHSPSPKANLDLILNPKTNSP